MWRTIHIAPQSIKITSLLYELCKATIIAHYSLLITHFVANAKGDSIMPYVNIKITREGEVTSAQKAQLIKGVTDLLANVLHKNPASTVVVIDEVPLDNWGLGGDPILIAREKNKKK